MDLSKFTSGDQYPYSFYIIIKYPNYKSSQAFKKVFVLLIFINYIDAQKWNTGITRELEIPSLDILIIRINPTISSIQPIGSIYSSTLSNKFLNCRFWLIKIWSHNFHLRAMFYRTGRGSELNIWKWLQKTFVGI